MLFAVPQRTIRRLALSLAVVLAAVGLSTLAVPPAHAAQSGR
ncbi:MAG TPA: hypothetical protein VIT65_24545 [Microlunatus sp.]